MSRDTGRGGGRAATVSEALDDLKDRGSMLLVVGERDRESLSAACERLRGAAGPDRRRLYVRTDGAASVEPASDVPSETVVFDTNARSTATASAGAGAAERVVDGDLSDLQAALADAVADLRPEGGFEPAELRVCIDAADALLSAHDDARVFQLFHALGGRMRETRGMCHVHLPVAIDDEHVQVLAPLFDAIIEVRRGREQRWHLREPDVTTDWLPL